jgi:hypothetical protein
MEIFQANRPVNRADFRRFSPLTHLFFAMRTRIIGDVVAYS